MIEQSCPKLSPASAPAAKPLRSYHEVTIGRTLYRVTSVYKGEIELKKALEDLTVSRALSSAQAAPGAGV